MEQNEQEPVVITKPDTPFFFSPKFLAGLAIFMIILGGFLGYKFLYKPIPPTQPSELAQVKPIKSLKSVIGTVEAIDSQKSTITINNSNGEKLSFPVSSDVLISQIVLGVKAEEGKQISLPTNLLYIEDLKTKTGQEVYLVFDEAGSNVIQIQMYQKRRANNEKSL